jgi:predicted YcjX-like family ATPase
MALFPYEGRGGLGDLLRDRYAAYQAAVRRDLVAPGFGQLDRLVVLADVLSALHAGPAAFADAAGALLAVSRALRQRSRFAWLAPLWPALGGIDRIAYVASKADHVAARQRGNLASLVRAIAEPQAEGAAFAVASMRCTEDIVWSLDGHPVSAVRGRVASGQAAKSYPGEVPDRPPEPGFWEHRFLSLPDFEPLRVASEGRLGVPNVDLDRLLLFLLEDVL